MVTSKGKDKDLRNVLQCVLHCDAWLSTIVSNRNNNLNTFLVGLGNPLFSLSVSPSTESSSELPDAALDSFCESFAAAYNEKQAGEVYESRV
jgi:hypothetical protein